MDQSTLAGLERMGSKSADNLIAAIEKVRIACAKTEMPLGIFHGDPAKAIEYGEKGFSLIACGVDSIVLGNASAALATQLNKALKN